MSLDTASLGHCRRNTASSWRSTRSSASFEASERASSAIHRGHADQHQVEHPIHLLLSRLGQALLPGALLLERFHEHAGCSCPYPQPATARFGVPHTISTAADGRQTTKGAVMHRSFGPDAVICP